MDEESASQEGSRMDTHIDIKMYLHKEETRHLWECGKAGSGRSKRIDRGASPSHVRPTTHVMDMTKEPMRMLVTRFEAELPTSEAAPE